MIGKRSRRYLAEMCVSGERRGGRDRPLLQLACSDNRRRRGRPNTRLAWRCRLPIVCALLCASEPALCPCEGVESRGLRNLPSLPVRTPIRLKARRTSFAIVRVATPQQYQCQTSIPAAEASSPWIRALAPTCSSKPCACKRQDAFPSNLQTTAAAAAARQK